MKVLYSTFGFDKEKVTRAMRSLAYDRLVIVTSEDNTRSEEYLDILEINRMSRTPVDTLIVDKFDLLECFEDIMESLLENKKNNDSVAINISGGTSLLACAAMLAAFQTGVEAYHVDDAVVRLPVLRHVSFEETLTEGQRGALLNFVDGVRLDEIRAMRKSNNERDLLIDYLALKKIGMLESKSEDDLARLYLTKFGQTYKRFLAKGRK